MTAQTSNLERLAQMDGCGDVKRMVDKLTRDKMPALRCVCRRSMGGLCGHRAEGGLMAKRLKTITAGRLVVVGCYTIPTPRSTERERKALREISSAAQMTINANRSWQRLELLLAANFGRRDLHVVLTYDDEHLPANRQAAVQRVRKMLPQLRAVRKSRGQELKYIYVTEQLSSEGGRLHHHMVVNGTGCGLDVLISGCMVCRSWRPWTWQPRRPWPSAFLRP